MENHITAARKPDGEKNLAVTPLPRLDRSAPRPIGGIHRIAAVELALSAISDEVREMSKEAIVKQLLELAELIKIGLKEIESDPNRIGVVAMLEPSQRSEPPALPRGMIIDQRLIDAEEKQ